VNTGDVRYALLEFDPGFFKSEKLFAVPVKELKKDGDKDALRYLDASRQKMERAGVDKADWKKAVDNRRYVEGLDQNYGYKPVAGTSRSFRASELIGKDVNSRAGKDIGDIKELVVDLNASKISYAVLAFDPSWTAGEKLYAFPLTAFKMNKDKDDLMLDVDQSMIASMKAFDANKWSSLNDLRHDEFVNPTPMTKR
ncbi:MAG: PRC-barrel domain containing protein, partial [Proteobacteria bacterium]